MPHATALAPPVHALLMGAALCAQQRQVPYDRRLRLGTRIYDTMNPLGCVRCQLPFAGADVAEVCPLCVRETAPRNYTAIATAIGLRAIYAALDRPLDQPHSDDLAHVVEEQEREAEQITTTTDSAEVQP